MAGIEDFLGGALSGAGTGSALGPWGALAGGVLGGITGLFQKKKGNQLLKNNPRPQEQMPPEVLANQEAAKRMADEGLPSQQYANATKNIQRNQAAALSNAQDRRLGGALVGSIQQQTNDATGNLDVADAEARRQSQLNLQNVNNNVAGWQSKLFDWNQRQKYIDQQAYAQGLIGAGNTNFYGGIDKLAGGLIGGLANRGGSAASPGGSYSSSGPGLATTSSGYEDGSNTDVVMDPNAYSHSALING